MPKIWYAHGFSFSFYSADGGRAKWWLDEGREARSRGFNEKDRAAIARIIRTHRHEMLDRWNDFFPPTDR